MDSMSYVPTAELSKVVMIRWLKLFLAVVGTSEEANETKHLGVELVVSHAPIVKVQGLYLSRCTYTMISYICLVMTTIEQLELDLDVICEELVN